MMHRCNMGACSCGLYHTQTNSYPMLFSMSSFDDDDEGGSDHMYQPGSVDCTLSLGTPSTRRSSENHDTKRSSNSLTGFGWNVFPSKHSLPSSVGKGHCGGCDGGGGGDPLLARRCANCDTTSTPLWRNGPRGPKSLCNACGIRFKKEERRATAVATTGNTQDIAEHAKMNGGSWNIPPQKMPYYSSYGNEFRFMEEHDQDQNHHDPETGIPFMAWRINVTDRPSLVHH